MCETKVGLSEDQKNENALKRIVKTLHGFWSLGNVCHSGLVGVLLRDNKLLVDSSEARDYIYHMFNNGYTKETVVGELKRLVSEDIFRDVAIETNAEKTQKNDNKVKTFAFEILGEILKELYQEGSNNDYKAHSRIFERLICDDFITKGRSIMLKPNQKGYREHVVPCVCIIDKAFDMFKNNGSIEDVVKMIQKNLRIVRITKEEQKCLDNEHKLKTKMPDGWEFGDDDIYARLKEADIEWTSLDN